MEACHGGSRLSSINDRLSDVRKLVGEARHNRMLGIEEAARPDGIPNGRQQGSRLGDWLTREQAKSCSMPDRSTLNGRRDYVILALLVGCACAGRSSPRSRLIVAVPLWVKQGINAWMTASGASDARSKAGALAR